MAVATCTWAASITYGHDSSMRRPAQYSGNCGPGTLVATVLTKRCGVRNARRAPSASSIGGAKPASPTSTSPATALCVSFTYSICSCSWRNRSWGAPTPTGSSANTVDTRLARVPRSATLRTDTGTMVRTVRASRRSPRAASRSRTPRVTRASTTSLTVPSSSRRARLTSSSDTRARVQRRCGPMGPLSDV